jgi:hypothetical protein
MGSTSIELAHAVLKNIERRHSLGLITLREAKAQIGLTALALGGERENPALAALGAYLLFTA